MKTAQKHKNNRAIPREISITQEIQSALISFIELHPPHLAKRTLRKMFLDYLKTPTVSEELYFRDVVRQMDGLFDLLDVIDDSLNPKDS